MNATSDSESDWFYESSCVEVWSADLQQIRELGSIESDTMAAIQEGKVPFVPFAFLNNFVCFTDSVHLNFEQLFKVCFTEDGMNFSSVNIPEQNQDNLCLEDEKKAATSQVN